mgnify:FL=1
MVEELNPAAGQPGQGVPGEPSPADSPQPGVPPTGEIAQPIDWTKDPAYRDFQAKIDTEREQLKTQLREREAELTKIQQERAKAQLDATLAGMPEGEERDRFLRKQLEENWQHMQEFARNTK